MCSAGSQILLPLPKPAPHQMLPTMAAAPRGCAREARRSDAPRSWLLVGEARGAAQARLCGASSRRCQAQGRARGSDCLGPSADGAYTPHPTSRGDTWHALRLLVRLGSRLLMPLAWVRLRHSHKPRCIDSRPTAALRSASSRVGDMVGPRVPGACAPCTASFGGRGRP